MKIEMKIGPTIVATDQPTMRNMTKGNDEDDANDDDDDIAGPLAQRRVRDSITSFLAT